MKVLKNIIRYWYGTLILFLPFFSAGQETNTKHIQKNSIIDTTLLLERASSKIPKNANAYDLDDKRTGTWTILYDASWEITDNIDSVEFYRIITYERGIPKGKVVDYYISGNKQWEGYLLSDDPEDIHSGKCEWFNKDGDLTQKSIITEQIREDFYYEQNQLLLKVLVKNDTLLSYNIYIKDTLSFPSEMLYKLESYDLENDSKALELNLECLALYEKIHGKEHPDYAVSLNNASLNYYKLGRYRKSLALKLEVLELIEKFFGKVSLNYTVYLYEVASSYDDLGDYSKALELKLECLQLSKKIHGEEHPDYATILNNLASSYSRFGDYNKALELDLECLELAEKSVKNDTPFEFAQLYLIQNNDFELAKKLLIQPNDSAFVVSERLRELFTNLRGSKDAFTLYIKSYFI